MKKIETYSQKLLIDQNSYTDSKIDLIKYKFDNIDKIKQNYSASYQDMFVLTMLNGKTDGYYVDIGGGDPVLNSNSYLLEKYFNWNGISFDLKSELAIEWNNKRDNVYINEDAINFNYSDYFEKNNYPYQIDYLSLDIEPLDNTLKCLENLPLDKYRFSVITYETDYYAGVINFSNELANHVRERSREIFKSYGYIMISGNVSAISDECPYEDWYVDPNIVDANLINLFIQKNDNSKYYESIILK